MESQHMESSLCTNGCGFYGSVQNANLCSKCYKQYQKQQHQAIDSPPSLMARLPLDAETVAVSTDQTASNRRTNLCSSCNKRLGLMGFSCRCGNVFCRSHRHPEDHACSVDFKGLGRQLLIKQNPLCKADKLQDRI